MMYLRTERDSQRQKLYDAELCIRKKEYAPQAENFINKIVSSVWWRRRCDISYVKITYGRGYYKGSYSRYIATANHYFQHGERIGEITVRAKEGLSKAVLLHELAHIYTYSNLDRGHAAHGAEFAKVYLELVKRYLGSDTARDLKASFKEHKVKFLSKRVSFDIKYDLVKLSKTKLYHFEDKIVMEKKSYRVSEKCEQALLFLNSMVTFSMSLAKARVRAGEISSQEIYDWVRKFGYRWNGIARDWFLTYSVKDMEDKKRKLDYQLREWRLR